MIVDDVNALAGDVADVVNVAELARLRIDENIALQNILAVGQDKCTLFGLAEESVDERFNNAIVTNWHEDIRLELRGSLKILVEYDFQIGIHKNSSVLEFCDEQEFNFVDEPVVD